MARSRYQVFPGDTSPYFLTLTALNFLPLFSNPEIASILLNSLKFLTDSKRLILYAYVILENHLHLIVAAENLRVQIARFKSFTARQSIDFFQDNGHHAVLKQLQFFKARHKVDRDFQLWQEGSHPKQIQGSAMMRQKIDYIHFNPVRRGYVDEPEHWRYSSARNYAGQPGLIEVCRDWI